MAEEFPDPSVNISELLRTSLASRAVIDQALGVIMALLGCTAAEALVIVRCASHNRNVNVPEIAERIVTGITGPPPQEPPFSAPR